MNNPRTLSLILGIASVVFSFPHTADASWPELRPAPQEWVVADKFGEFASWWPGQPDEEAARAALKQAMRRETLGINNEFTAAMQLLPVLANSIRWEKPHKGAQQSHLYRSDPNKWTKWDKPSNARLMEPVTLLARFYALNEPWNPYYHDAALGLRLTAALEYWLSLQGPEGGFPEYADFGVSELPSTAFNLMAMAEVYQTLKDDPLFAGLSPRWVEAMKRAVTWGATSERARNQGAGHANQYLGIIAGTWHVYTITDDEQWKTMYDELTEWWLGIAQTSAGWYREGGGREDFAYSLVTNLYADHLALETGDPRWLESLRRASLASEMIVVYEMDRSLTVMDVAGYTRTTPTPTLNFITPSPKDDTNPYLLGRAPQRFAGWFNHMADALPEARAFALGAWTAEEADRLEQDYFAAMPESLSWNNPMTWYLKAGRGAFVWDGTGDYWTLPADAQLEAAAQTRPWKDERFTDVFVTFEGNNRQEFICIRRPGYYSTFYTGTVQGKQTLGLGLVWVPGFGALFASANNTARPAFGWMANGEELAKAVKRLSYAWEGEAGDNATGLSLQPEKGLPSIDFALGEDALIVRTTASPLYLPLICADGERWTLDDGSAWEGRTQSTTSLTLHRTGEQVTHDLVFDFSEPTEVRFRGASKFAPGLSLRSMTVTSPQGQPLEMTLRRVPIPTE